MKKINNFNKNSRIFVAGHRGLVGSAIVRKLEKDGYKKIIKKTSKELDLKNRQALEKFFVKEKPEFIFLAAAKVGGIMANKNYPADFIFENIAIQTNIIELAHKYKVKKLLFLGSSCIYPRDCPQPIQEKYLLTGPLEETNKPYAIAKISGIVMCHSFNAQYGTNFISVMPTNLYGQNDNFHPENSHVLPALIRKFHEAKTSNSPSITIWGTGIAKREFLHVDDLAEACVFLMKKYNNDEIINIGTGEDIPIRKLAEKISSIVGFKGKIIWDKTKPDGTPRKLLNVNKIHKLGWKHKIPLSVGLKDTYAWFQKNINRIKN